ncbi:PilW family protein [Chitiniphilus eburneus]|uniref:Prepilin-type N-terminal cleavage/methylation domain-containing protein n=1 Tax=Chitiniphilus eburneus TaxID=2571148 RepID=A0A4U0PLR4_9NEIS|nr:prepilin-type N-terminal cleavage/methylation domain-containing protein [Chitiniphilus eburneus]TJZ69017.1 hypothetical protein FAZ21_15225 [Chitiniphilus eburneus]
MLASYRKSQTGMTIIELLISATIALVILSAAFSLYINSLNTAKDVTLLTRLNNEVSAAMNLISRDLKRAGYCANSTLNECRAMPLLDSTSPPINSPTSADTSLRATLPTVNAFIVEYDISGRAAYPFSPLTDFTNGCALYAYDTPPEGGANIGTPGKLDSATSIAGGAILDERHGFWLDGDVIKVFTGSTSAATVASHSCAASSAWQAITDRNAVTVTALNFTYSPASLSTSTSGGVTYNDFSPASVTITITACSTQQKYSSQTGANRCGPLDQRFSQTLTETVYLPNFPERLS